jgi:hypothetical protein
MSTALAYACLTNDTATIAKLLEEGEPVDSVDPQGRTPVMLTLLNGKGKYDAFELLVVRGADLLIADRSGLRPQAVAELRLENDELKTNLAVAWNRETYLEFEKKQLTQRLASSAEKASDNKLEVNALKAEVNTLKRELREAADQLLAAKSETQNPAQARKVARRAARREATEILKYDGLGLLDNEAINSSMAASSSSLVVASASSSVRVKVRTGDKENVSTTSKLPGVKQAMTSIPPVNVGKEGTRITGLMERWAVANNAKPSSTPSSRW